MSNNPNTSSIASPSFSSFGSEVANTSKTNSACKHLWVFFYCIAELAVKPCRSSRTNTRGGFEKSNDTCKTGNKQTQSTRKQTPSKQTHKTPTQTTSGKYHWMVRQVVKKSETPEAARSSHVLNSTRKHKVSLVQLS